MRLSFFIIIVFTLTCSTLLSGEEILLKLNKKEVDTGSKIERFFSLFTDPPVVTKIEGPSKVKVLIRKIIDKKNPLTKLPVTVTISLDAKKVKEITLNDREGSAVIKDATRFNAGPEKNISFNIPEGEHQLRVSVTRSAIKGVLIRIEKISSNKQLVVNAPQPPAEKGNEKDNFIPPIIPPLAPLVQSSDQKPAGEAKPIISSADVKKGEKLARTKETISAKKSAPVLTKKERPQTDKTPFTKRTAAIQKKAFGDIVILSLKGGMILPLEYGNPGGYGEFSTSFNIYKGILIGASISSYNINRDYIINDPNTGNSILKYHLHGVPLSGFIGYRYQMQNILTKLEVGSGVNMTDIDIRREYTSEKIDTINSYIFNLSSELSYITRYGSLGAGMKYLYSNASNMDKKAGFVKNINTGGLIFTIGYHYGF